MSEFQELIRDFEKIRQYILEFYIYGFKTRNDFEHKSLRTYDNEKRRIESYFKDLVSSDYDGNNKRVFISFDSSKIYSNPLYSAWKSRSFTNNDIILHFFILDILMDQESYSVKEITNEILKRYGFITDIQIVRLKAKEYEDYKILISKKVGNTIEYRLNINNKFPNQTIDAIKQSLLFFTEALPLGVIGSFIKDENNWKNDFMTFKHNFIVHTLEDQVLMNILKAIKQKSNIKYIQNTKDNRQLEKNGLPLKILISSQTGRRYVCLYYKDSKRFSSIRLDNISDVEILSEDEQFNYYSKKVSIHIEKAWGVSFGGKNNRNEIIEFKIYFDEKYEKYILERLINEGRGGEIHRVEENIYSYKKELNDSNEILPWLKTFTGRILELTGSNEYVVSKYYNDVKRHYYLYRGD